MIAVKATPRRHVVSVDIGGATAVIGWVDGGTPHELRLVPLDEGVYLLEGVPLVLPEEQAKK